MGKDGNIPQEVATQKCELRSEEALIPDKKISLKKIDQVVTAMELTEKTPEECCEKVGLTLDKVYTRLGQMLDAEAPFNDKYQGAVMYPDNRVRLAAITLILELRKHIKDKSVITQVGIFNDPRVAEEAKRVLKLRDRMADGS